MVEYVFSKSPYLKSEYGAKHKWMEPERMTNLFRKEATSWFFRLFNDNAQRKHEKTLGALFKRANKNQMDFTGTINNRFNSLLTSLLQRTHKSIGYSVGSSVS